MISVAAVIYDTIAINIPGAFDSVIAEIEARIEKQQTMPDSAPIVFTARINSHGQQQTIMIPQENITAIEKGVIYFVKVSDRAASSLVTYTIHYTTCDRLNLSS